MGLQHRQGHPAPDPRHWHRRARPRARLAASGLPGIDDFKFLSARSGIVFAALNSQDEVAVVCPDGRSRIVLTAADDLAYPSDTYISGTRLYIADSGRLAPHDSKLQEARISISALLDPLNREPMTARAGNRHQ